jgi:serine protease Do
VVYQDACRLVLANGQTVEGRVVARDGDNDLTAVRVDVPDAVEIQPINAQSSKGLQIGQLVVAIGHPMGAEWAATVGILSRIPGPEDRRRVLRASITLLPGNSGGPLIDATGALIGINTMVSGPAEAIAVPHDVVAQFVVSVLAHPAPA